MNVQKFILYDSFLYMFEYFDSIYIKMLSTDYAISYQLIGHSDRHGL